MFIRWVVPVLALCGLGVMIWGSDRITLEGERTVYTVICKDGAWNDLRCTGHLAPGDRHRFRASRSRNEVIYWIAGSTAPSGKYSDCQVKNRDNWTCNVTTGQPAAIAYEFSNGRPTPSRTGLTAPFHAVAKWKWWLLDAGVLWIHDADFRGGAD
jgi:hypothetical protein